MARKIFGRKRTPRKIGLKSLTLLILLVIIGFEIFAVLGERQSRRPLPPLFGNFAETRSLLEKAELQEEFSFAVFGDTEGSSAFKVLARKLRAQPVDFAVHLGNAFDARTYPHFRAQLQGHLALPFPVFFLPGNQDIKALPLPRFEEIFGPSIFSFTYQECLFVGLSVQGDPDASTASLQFLEDVLAEAGQRYRKIFVFMHVPAQVLPGTTLAAPEKMNELFARDHVDYVFASHYHGYAHVQKGGTTHIVSGAAGGHLEESPYGQFHHGLVITVGQDFVSKTVVPLAVPSDIGNKLRCFALVDLYPWLIKNRALVAIANLVFILLVIITIRSFLPREREDPLKR